jgi:hypothetical protein
MKPDILRQLTEREAATVTKVVSGVVSRLVDGNFNSRTVAVPLPTDALIETTAPISGFDLRRVAEVLHGMNIGTSNPRVEPITNETHRLAVKFDVIAYGADQVRVEKVDPFQGDREMETFMNDLFRPRQ